MSIPIIIPIIVTILALVYIFSPLDFIPDVVPVVGWSDDLFVIVVTLIVWLFYFGVKFIEDLLSGVASGNIASIAVTGGIIVGIVLLSSFAKRRRN